MQVGWKIQAESSGGLTGFADRLKQLMAERELRVVDVARGVDVAASTVSSWRMAKNWPELETGRRLAHFLDVSESFLFSGEAEAPPASLEECRRLIEPWLAAAEADSAIAGYLASMIRLHLPGHHLTTLLVGSRSRDRDGDTDDSE